MNKTRNSFDARERVPVAKHHLLKTVGGSGNVFGGTHLDDHAECTVNEVGDLNADLTNFSIGGSVAHEDSQTVGDDQSLECNLDLLVGDFVGMLGEMTDVLTNVKDLDGERLGLAR